MLRTHNTNRFSPKGIYNLQKLGLIDENGDVVEEEILNMLRNKYY